MTIAILVKPVVVLLDSKVSLISVVKCLMVMLVAIRLSVCRWFFLTGLLHLMFRVATRVACRGLGRWSRFRSAALWMVLVGIRRPYLLGAAADMPQLNVVWARAVIRAMVCACAAVGVTNNAHMRGVGAD